MVFVPPDQFGSVTVRLPPAPVVKVPPELLNWEMVCVVPFTLNEPLIMLT